MKKQYITLSFEIVDEEREAFVEGIRALKDFWEESGFEVSLYRDAVRKERYVQAFLTDRGVDELTALIQGNARTRELFEWIKEKGGRVIISVMEKLV